VSLAPLRFGAGTKGKIIESWKVGTPVVGTRIAAEGMWTADYPFGGAIADSTREFAESALALHDRISSWSEARDRGSRILANLHAAPALDAALIAKIGETLRDLAAFRGRNFVGRILLREQLRSTEYFSRWIEAKNRYS
jgi:hypothetical protein